MIYGARSYQGRGMKMTKSIVYSEVFKSAWSSVKGAKLVFFIVFFIAGLILAAESSLQVAIQAVEKNHAEVPFVKDHLLASGIIYVLLYILLIFLGFGLKYLGILRARGADLKVSLILYTFRFWLLLKMLWMEILKCLLFAVILFPSIATAAYIPKSLAMVFITISFLIIIYLSIRFCISDLLLIDKNCGPIFSLRASFKATRRLFYPIFTLKLTTLLLASIAVLPFGIGLLWAIPLLFIVDGAIYQKILPLIAEANSQS
jgi:hypothetical protein